MRPLSVLVHGCINVKICMRNGHHIISNTHVWKMAFFLTINTTVEKHDIGVRWLYSIFQSNPALKHMISKSSQPSKQKLACFKHSPCFPSQCLIPLACFMITLKLHVFVGYLPTRQRGKNHEFPTQLERTLPTIAAKANTNSPLACWAPV